MLKLTLIAAFFAAQIAAVGAFAGFSGAKHEATVEQGGGPSCTPDECCWDESCEEEEEDN